MNDRTEFEPVVCLRVVGTDEEGGNSRNSFDYHNVRLLEEKRKNTILREGGCLDFG